MLMKYTAKECRCWQKYPNSMQKRANGEWKCVDCYELIKQGDWKHKTRCKLKEINANGNSN